MPVDDLDLDRDGVTPPPVPTGSGRAWNPWLIAAAVALAIGGGAFIRWWTLQRPAPAADATQAATATDVPLTSAPALPPLDQMDPYLRALLRGLSTRPELAAWLATDNLIQQMALTIDRVSRGVRYESVARVWSPNTTWKAFIVAMLRKHGNAFEPY